MEQAFGACILAGPLAIGDKTVVRIHNSGIPYLALGRLDEFPECSYATVNYDEATYMSTNLLVERGHRRIGMLSAFAGYQPGVERQRGYLRALEGGDIPYDDRIVRSVTFGSRNIANMVHRILDRSDVTALVDCSGAEDGDAVAEGARRAGRVIGKDLEVVAWTYINDTAVVHDACAHVWVPIRESAADGFEQLAAWIDGKREGPIQILYSPTLLRVHSQRRGAQAPPPL